MGLMEAEKGFVYVTRRMQFAAAHRLCHPELHHEIFGKCSALHGHNYTVEVTVRGRVDERTGFVVDLKELKKLMQEHIMDVLDHKNIDEDIEYFRDKTITQSAENIAIFIWQLLQDRFSQQVQAEVSLYRVRLYETENNLVEYFG